MSLTRFQTEWSEIADRWGLRVETPFAVKVSGGTLTVPVLLRDFGAVNGMLLVTDYKLLSPYVDELGGLGFGFSTLSEPTDRPRHSHADDALIEMIIDWGWSGRGSPPAWYRDRTG
jgi:hypothetical protein